MADNSTPAHALRSRGNDGFTLIELVIVLSLVGILASISLPNMRFALYRAKRVEAQLGLKGIYTAQRAFYAENGFYADDFTQLGLMMAGGQLLDEQTIKSRYYTYTLHAVAGGANFFAMAAGDIAPGNGITDVVIIQDDVTIVE